MHSLICSSLGAAINVKDVDPINVLAVWRVLASAGRNRLPKDTATTLSLSITDVNFGTRPHSPMFLTFGRQATNQVRLLLFHTPTACIPEAHAIVIGEHQPLTSQYYFHNWICNGLLRVYHHELLKCWQ